MFSHNILHYSYFVGIPTTPKLWIELCFTFNLEYCSVDFYHWANLTKPIYTKYLWDLLWLFSIGFESAVNELLRSDSGAEARNQALFARSDTAIYNTALLPFQYFRTLNCWKIHQSTVEWTIRNILGIIASIEKFWECLLTLWTA